MDARFLKVVFFSAMLAGCGGGSGSSESGAGPEGSGEPDGPGTFAVPEASGGDGLDKVISLMNVQSQPQTTHGLSGLTTESPDELAYSRGCSSATTRSRADFPSAASITSEQVCVGTECATASNNALLVTDASEPDLRRDTIHFYGGTVEVASSVREFDMEAGSAPVCEEPPTENLYPGIIEGEYKGFIYQRSGETLGRSAEVALSCVENQCQVTGGVIDDTTLELAPEGNSEPRYIEQEVAMTLPSGTPSADYRVLLTVSPGGKVLGGIGIPATGTVVCSRDCVTVAFEKQ